MSGSEEKAPAPKGTIEEEALAQLERWAGVRKGDARARKLIAEYWRDGVGLYGVGSDVPWSGAFMAYVANRVHRGSLLKAGSHAQYAAHGLAAKPGQYETKRPELAAPLRPGDIVIKPRAGQVARFEDLTGQHFPSHGDFVVSVQGGAVQVVGGNKVGGVVARETLALDSRGLLPEVFAVMQRKAKS